MIQKRNLASRDLWKDFRLQTKRMIGWNKPADPDADCLSYLIEARLRVPLKQATVLPHINSTNLVEAYLKWKQYRKRYVLQKYLRKLNSEQRTTQYQPETPETYSESCETSNIERFAFHKTLHLRYLIRFWIRLWALQVEEQLSKAKLKMKIYNAAEKADERETKRMVLQFIGKSIIEKRTENRKKFFGKIWIEKILSISEYPWKRLQIEVKRIYIKGDW